MNERQTVRNEVHSIHADEWPNTLDELFAHLRALRESVPVEWQNSIEIEFEYDSWDGGAGYLEIYYDCPETDEHMAERIASDANDRREVRERDLRQLAALKIKYEAAE